MKRLAGLASSVAAAILLLAMGPAQAAQISGMGGYQFGGQIETSSGDIEMNDAAAFLAEIEFPLKFKTGTSLMLMWGLQPTNLQWDSPTGKVDLGEITAHYWHGGLLYNLKTDNPALVPFTQVGLGATQLNPANGESKTKFSFGMGAGLKYSVNPKVAIRFQGELYATMLTSDAWVGVGTGGASVSMGGNALLQGAIMGGVTLSLGGSKEKAEPAPATMPASQPVQQQPPPQEPPAQQPPATEPPPGTEPPPSQQPPVTEPPVPEPPAAQPPATQTTGTTPPR